MEMKFALEEMTTSLVSHSYLSSEEDMDVDIDTLPVTGTERHASDSVIKVVACYKNVPVRQKDTVAKQNMTTGLSVCAKDDLPEFLWAEFEDIW